MPSLADLFSRVPQPGTWGQENYWPFSAGTLSDDIARNKDITTLLEDYGGLEGQRGPGDDVGPMSSNVEDRRGQPYVPLSAIQQFLADFRGGHFAYPGRRYGPYDADIDASVQRQKALRAITPALRELANRENWFRVFDRPEEPGPEPPPRVREEYRRVFR